jgi:hypothetical protein
LILSNTRRSDSRVAETVPLTRLPFASAVNCSNE